MPNQIQSVSGPESGPTIVPTIVPTIIPSAIRTLLGVYEQQLSTVEFPGVSAAGLHAQVETVLESTRQLDLALTVVREARASVEQETAELLKIAERGLAYARVYAGDDASLAETLAAIELQPGSTNKPRKRRKLAPPAGGGKTAKTSVDPATKPQLALDQLSASEPSSPAAA